MGATHVAAYQAAARDGFPCKLVAVCDSKASRRAGMHIDSTNLALCRHEDSESDDA